jgi:hypothetical protein
MLVESFYHVRRFALERLPVSSRSGIEREMQITFSLTAAILRFQCRSMSEGIRDESNYLVDLRKPIIGFEISMLA